MSLNRKGVTQETELNNYIYVFSPQKLSELYIAMVTTLTCKLKNAFRPREKEINLYASLLQIN